MPTKKYFISFYGFEYVDDGFERQTGAKYKKSKKQKTKILSLTKKLDGLVELKLFCQKVNEHAGKHSKLLTIVDLEQNKELYNSQKKHTHSFMNEYVNPKKAIQKI